MSIRQLKLFLYEKYVQPKKITNPLEIKTHRERMQRIDSPIRQVSDFPGYSPYKLNEEQITIIEKRDVFYRFQQEYIDYRIIRISYLQSVFWTPTGWGVGLGIAYLMTITPNWISMILGLIGGIISLLSFLGIIIIFFGFPRFLRSRIQKHRITAFERENNVEIIVAPNKEILLFRCMTKNEIINWDDDYWWPDHL